MIGKTNFNVMVSEVLRMPARLSKGASCPYAYAPGQARFFQYGGYANDKKELFRAIKAEERGILRLGGRNNRRICMELQGTVLDSEVAHALVLHMKEIRPAILKLAVVGCGFFARRRLKKRMMASGLETLAKQMRFFPDVEQAEQWLEE